MHLRRKTISSSSVTQVRNPYRVFFLHVLTCSCRLIDVLQHRNSGHTFCESFFEQKCNKIEYCITCRPLKQVPCYSSSSILDRRSAYAFIIRIIKLLISVNDIRLCGLVYKSSVVRGNRSGFSTLSPEKWFKFSSAKSSRTRKQHSLNN